MRRVRDRRPSTAARRAWAKLVTRRQSEAGRPRAPATGGSVQGDALDHAVDQQGCDQMSVEPSPGQVGVLGRQAVEVQDRFQPFEGELHLPA